MKGHQDLIFLNKCFLLQVVQAAHDEKFHFIRNVLYYY